ncbi:MAG: hypothetical protein H6811_08755 [Phycisphaeraceae bacterium]|nr:hypothetical protein [Phycisphaeraceae bacterium]
MPKKAPVVASVSGALALFAAAGFASFDGPVGPGPAALPNVIFPPENPLTESKRVLGKILFWEEQLSSDNTVSCGTCHQPGAAGTDPIRALNPGFDQRFNTPDDIFTSFGMIASDEAADYEPDPVFGLDTQTTPRAANSAVMAMYAPELFWDGRATSEFRDPVTGEVVIAAGGALESQAVGPIVSDVEMGHAARDWDHVTGKLATSVPLALASDIPPEMSDAIDANPTYPELFQAAFGDPEISASRIAMAIATYERTLVPDQTPWDRFQAGEQNAMTPGQIQGWNTLQAANCVACHAPPKFTDDTFRNIGVRPTAQDIGRQGVTGNPQDRGRFKVPSLRNVGLKSSLMHTGQFTNLNQVFPFYAGGGAGGNNNLDPLLPIAVPPPQVPAVIDFLANALTDPRVANETFPFDRPTLYVERPADRPANLGGGTSGSGGFEPRVIANAPPLVGSDGFKIGLDRALGGSIALVAISQSPPLAGVVPADVLEGPFVVQGAGAGSGYATFRWPIAADPNLDGQTFYMQWRVVDGASPGGFAFSDAIRVRLFCGSRCPEVCTADTDGDHDADSDDFFAFLDLFAAGDARADLDGDGDRDADDFFRYLDAFALGC